MMTHTVKRGVFDSSTPNLSTSPDSSTRVTRPHSLRGGWSRYWIVIKRTFLMTSERIVLLVRKLWSADSAGWTGLKRPCIAWLAQRRACNNMTNLLWHSLIMWLPHPLHTSGNYRWFSQLVSSMYPRISKNCAKVQVCSRDGKWTNDCALQLHCLFTSTCLRL